MSSPTTIVSKLKHVLHKFSSVKGTMSPSDVELLSCVFEEHYNTQEIDDPPITSCEIFYYLIEFTKLASSSLKSIESLGRWYGRVILSSTGTDEPVIHQSIAFAEQVGTIIHSISSCTINFDNYFITIPPTIVLGQVHSSPVKQIPSFSVKVSSRAEVLGLFMLLVCGIRSFVSPMSHHLSSKVGYAICLDVILSISTSKAIIEIPASILNVLMDIFQSKEAFRYMSSVQRIDVVHGILNWLVVALDRLSASIKSDIVRQYSAELYHICNHLIILVEYYYDSYMQDSDMINGYVLVENINSHICQLLQQHIVPFRRAYAEDMPSWVNIQNENHFMIQSDAPNARNIDVIKYIVYTMVHIITRTFDKVTINEHVDNQNLNEPLTIPFSEQYIRSVSIDVLLGSIIDCRILHEVSRIVTIACRFSPHVSFEFSNWCKNLIYRKDSPLTLSDIIMYPIPLAIESNMPKSTNLMAQRHDVNETKDGYDSYNADWDRYGIDDGNSMMSQNADIISQRESKRQYNDNNNRENMTACIHPFTLSHSNIEQSSFVMSYKRVVCHILENIDTLSTNSGPSVVNLFYAKKNRTQAVSVKDYAAGDLTSDSNKRKTIMSSNPLEFTSVPTVKQIQTIMLKETALTVDHIIEISNIVLAVEFLQLSEFLNVSNISNYLNTEEYKDATILLPSIENGGKYYGNETVLIRLYHLICDRTLSIIFDYMKQNRNLDESVCYVNAVCATIIQSVARMLLMHIDYANDDHISDKCPIFAEILKVRSRLAVKLFDNFDFLKDSNQFHAFFSSNRMSIQLYTNLYDCVSSASKEELWAYLIFHHIVYPLNIHGEEISLYQEVSIESCKNLITQMHFGSTISFAGALLSIYKHVMESAFEKNNQNKGWQLETSHNALVRILSIVCTILKGSLDRVFQTFSELVSFKEEGPQLNKCDKMAFDISVLRLQINTINNVLHTCYFTEIFPMISVMLPYRSCSRWLSTLYIESDEQIGRMDISDCTLVLVSQVASIVTFPNEKEKDDNNETARSGVAKVSDQDSAVFTLLIGVMLKYVQSHVGLVIRNARSAHEKYRRKLLYYQSRSYYCFVTFIQILTKLRIFLIFQRVTIANQTLRSDYKRVPNSTSHVAADSINTICLKYLQDTNVICCSSDDANKISTLLTVSLLDESYFSGRMYESIDEFLRHNKLFRDIDSILHASISAVITLHRQTGDNEKTQFSMHETKLWIIIPALANLAELCPSTEPQVAIWALSLLADCVTDPTSSFSYEIFSRLCKGGRASTLYNLLINFPHFAAKKFYISVLKNRRLNDCLQKLIGKPELRKLVLLHRYYIYEGILSTHDVEAFENYFRIVRGGSRLLGDFMSLTNTQANDPSVGRPIIENELYDCGVYFIAKLLSTSSDLESFNEQELLSGGFLVHIMSIISQVLPGYASNNDTSFLQRSFLSISILQRILRCLLWNLGSKHCRKDHAIKMLRIFCTLYRANSWVVVLSDIPNVHLAKQRRSGSRSEKLIDTILNTASSNGNADNVSSDLQENVSYVISTNMLYIIKHFQPDVDMDISNHAQSIRVLCQVILLLPVLDIGPHLSKIMLIIDTSLACPSPLIQNETLLLVNEVVIRLPDEVLCSHVPLLVAILFPILEQSILVIACGQQNSHGNANGYWDEAISFAMSKAKGRVSVSNIADKPDLPVTQMEPGYNEMSEEMEDLTEIVHTKEIGQRHVYANKKLAIKIITYLFNEKWKVIQNVATSIPAFPERVPTELYGVVNKHERKMRLLTLDQKISNLCVLLRHESSRLRVVALNHLITICMENKDMIYASIQNSSANGLMVAQESSITVLLSALLELCGKESDLTILNLLAKCLGELGAVDPAMISIYLKNSSKSVVLPARDLLPWELNKMEFGMTLLESYLVPGLRDLDLDMISQDRICFAVQEILNIVAKSDSVITGSGSEIKVQKDVNLPMNLKAELEKRNILDITEPFWSSIYKYERNESNLMLNGPIYQSNFSVRRWLGHWCKYLCTKATGDFHAIFYCCRGAVTGRVDLAQFLLPYLIADVIVSDNNSNGEYTNEILNEMLHVLYVAGGVNPNNALGNRDDNADMNGLDLELTSCRVSMSGFEKQNEKRNTDVSQKILSKHTGNATHMSVQAIFSLIDTFEKWIDTKNKSAGKLKKTSGTTSSSKSKAEAYSANAICSHLKVIVDGISKLVLGQAALKIGAYARAARYFEINARSEHVKSRISGKEAKIGSDGTVMQEESLQEILDEAEPMDLQSTSSSKLSTKHKGKGKKADLSTDIPMISRNDAAIGELPVLSPFMIDLLMEVFFHLDDCDTVQGIRHLAQVYNVPSTHFNRILEYEQMDKHTYALIEYESLQTQLSHIYNQFSAMNMSNSGSVGSAHGNDSNETTKRLKRTEAKFTPSKVNILQDNFPRDLPVELIGYLERGRLRCLEEMGQQDAVLNQFSGIVNQIPCIEPALLPTAIKASWQLQRWEELDDLLYRVEKVSISPSLTSDAGSFNLRTLGIHKDDGFVVSMGYLMSCLNHKDETGFANALHDARLETMSVLSAASMESYGRSYNCLIKLHMLRELEQGMQLVMECNKSPDPNVNIANGKSLIQAWNWENRLNMMSSSLKHRSNVMSLRRSLYEASNMTQEVAENWISVSKIMTHAKVYDAASVALRNAQRCGIDAQEALLQECLLSMKYGDPNKALLILEPTEPDVTAIRNKLRKVKSLDNLGYLEGATERLYLGKKLLLAAQIMTQSRVRHGTAITDRFKLAISLLNDKEPAHFALANYYEDLLSHSTGSNDSDENDETYCKNLYLAIENYVFSIMSGSEHLMQSLPKLITLWLTVTSPNFSINNNASQSNFKSTQTNKKGESKSAESSLISRVSAHVNVKLRKACNDIPAHVWYRCMPQIVSRIGHSNTETLNIIKEILVKIIVSFPQQGIWHMSSQIHSLNTERKKHSKAIVASAISKLQQSNDTTNADMLNDATPLFHSIVSLAQLIPQSSAGNKINVDIGKNCNLSRFLVPTQAALTMCDACSPALKNPSLRNDTGNVYFPSDQMFILQFDPNVEVLMTKAKPKKILILTTCGKSIKFLVKQEKNGDLRKDARMMEFNSSVNRVMQEDSEGRKRKLRLRIYSVVCLNEECGILEWVPNTAGFRNLVLDAYNNNSELYPCVNIREIRGPYEAVHQNYATDLLKILSEYKSLILQTYRPCFHLWFLSKYSDATEWIEARGTFTRSCAVWSAVGHIIGLGDRHGENILLDTVNGECVHVDFDCLFDKGLSLARPEIVPFRLTPNMVDAMGLTGVEGTYRRSMEVCMNLLRENKSVLLSVVEPFIRDPTVSWGRSGRAQRNNDVDMSGAKQVAIHDVENKDAEQALRKISQRLSGVYNIINPNAKLIVATYHANKAAPSSTSMGLGAYQEEELPLSVTGQVQRLIEEATAEINLAQMYIGWMPWL